MSGKLKELMSSYDAIKSGMVKEVKKGFVDVFKAMPELSLIEWVQYTPYFNDGEPCEFRVGRPTLAHIKNLDEVLEAWEGPIAWDYLPLEGEWIIEDEKFGSHFWQNGITKYTPEQQKLFLKNKKLLEEVGEIFGAPEDVFHLAFGDHSMIRVTRDGVFVTDYEHD